jgi:predicted dehydrogenase
MIKMKICFVGLGSIAFKHLNNIKIYTESKNLLVDFYAVRSGLSDFEYPIEVFDIQEIKVNNLNSYFFDAVFITNPSHLHYPSLQDLINHTNSIFIEKPIFDRVDYNLEFINTSHKLIYVAAPLRHSNIIKEAKNFVESNKVLSCRIICSSYLPDWQKSRDYTKSFRINASTGGGIDLDLIHEIDYIIELFGWPTRILKIGKHYSDLIGDSYDFAAYLIEYSSLAVELHLDHFSKFKRREIELTIKGDVVVFDLLDNQVEYKINNLSKKIEGNNYYLNEIFYFFDLINNKVSNINDMNRAIKTLEIAKVE